MRAPRRRARAPAPWWSGLGSRPGRTSRPGGSRWPSASAWSWRGRWPRSPRCSCWTKSWRGSTRRRPRASSGSSPASTSPACPCCASSTTCARSWRSPTASWCSPSGRRSRRGRRAPSPATPASSKRIWARNMSTLLRLEGIEVGYGDLTAVREVSLEVRTGEVVALIGGNGAGKTTTLRAITGLLPVRRGVIELDGQRLDGLSPSRIVARGLAHVPEGRQLFPTMTVRENLELGAGGREARARRHETLEWVFRLFPRLQERNGQLAGTLSGGEQQMCAIGRG